MKLNLSTFHKVMDLQFMKTKTLMEKAIDTLHLRHVYKAQFLSYNLRWIFSWLIKI